MQAEMQTNEAETIGSMDVPIIGVVAPEVVILGERVYRIVVQPRTPGDAPRLIYRECVAVRFDAEALL